MGDAFITARGGGAGLNFKVVGNPQPITASKNTIWVDTDAAISEWIFSATEPTSPVGGMVWFKTALASSNVFNALKRNALMVYPASAKQYIGGIWVAKKAYRYNGTSWQSFSRLPAEYQEVEYLQGTGTQYINTGIVGSSITATAKVEAKAQWTTLNSSMIGAHDTDSYNNALTISTTSSGLFWLASEDADGYSPSDAPYAVNTDYELVADITKGGECTLIVNGELVISMSASGGFTSKSIYAIGKNASGTGKGFNGLVYYIKITINGVLVRDFVPCYRVADSVAGLYDLANDVFYTNAGSGTFIVGGDV